MSELTHPNLPEELQRLEFYRKQDARRTLVARSVLLTMIFGMLGANMWMTHQARTDMLTNLDQARLAQVQLDEHDEARIDALTQDLAALQQQVEALQLSLDEEETASEVVAAR